MISASAEFHRAVVEGHPQRAILQFGNGAYFTNEDISITAGGIHYEEVLNGETELTIGACPSSKIKVYLLKSSLPDGFTWGQFNASLGVRLEHSSYQSDAAVMIEDPSGTLISGHSEEPYLRINGVASDAQPSFPVYALVLENGFLHCIGASGASESGEWNGQTLTSLAGDLFYTATLPKLISLAAQHRGLICEGNIIIEFTDGIRSVWEYAELGTFIATRPEVLRTTVIEMEASDLMCLLDVMMPDIDASAFPMTIGDLLIVLCDVMGITCVTTDFINRDVVIPTKPESFSDATAREVLGWIAQAACSYARFNRQGRLELVWFSDVDLTMDESTFSEFIPSSYEVAPITKLIARNSDSTTDAVVGTDGNAYLIQDNPLLRQDDSAVALLAEETDTPTGLIYERLSSFPAFNPASLDSFYDWTIQAGDVVKVSSEGQEFRMPIYNLTLDWKGATKLSLENTGSEYQPPIPQQERWNFGSGRSSYQTKKELEAVRTWAQIQVNEQAALITLLTGRVDTIEDDFSAASIRIDGLEAEIALRVEKNGVIAAINMSAEEGILIQASKIDLDGFVTMSEFNALQGEVDRITSGTGVIETMQVSTLLAEVIQNVSSISADYGWFTHMNVAASGTLTLFGSNAKWKSITYLDSNQAAQTVTVLATG